jgi:tRNA-2-methylthio-N6-dimethylallyladenosine synthase
VIIDEIRDLLAHDVKEVTLLGQNVNSFGKDLGEGWNFARLLREIAQTGIHRIRFQTSHPKDLSDELIAAIATEKNVSRHLHLPFQAGSSRILQKMNRQDSKEDYIALAARIKTRVPDISMTTDIIVGFPGETEEDFLDTLDVVKQVRFDGAFTFIYSPRVGTPAAKMEDTATDEVKKERLIRLIELQNRIGLENNQALIGSVQEILVEGASEKNQDIWSGRTSQNKLVHFKPTVKVKPGDNALVRISGAKTFTLEGELLG